ncbi:ferredoxin--NADP reductase [Fulvivirga sp. M361]|uniref:ferredoxin--NADP reductase n=1 Tax=Fulvivirga sp. M361 TaxID=2594266 RepID=UPI001179AFF5|nr:ferredoxin--NADP reductase [Fulvivirga sp. M361]TRX56107.1 ferredoxin--NADP reductase [Fulvivirga sp. M361]
MAFSFFKKSKSKEESAKKSNTTQYFDLKVIDIVRETQDAISIVFEQPNTPILYKSGQFLTLINTIDGKEVRRAYSLCSSPYTEQHLAVAVKRVENGVMSNWLANNLKVGDTMKIMEPMGAFTVDYDQNNDKHLVMFAGGSGITPMLSIIKSTLDQESHSVITLIYANRNSESIIFKETLERLAEGYQGRLVLIHVLDVAPDDWKGYAGLLDQEILTKIFDVLPEHSDTTYLLCGPEGMMRTVESFLADQNISKEQLLKESFVASTNTDGAQQSDPGSKIITREVIVIYDGEEHKFEVEPSSTILETALDQGIDLPYSCQSGLCTACRGKCISGKVKLDEEEGLSEEETAEGYVLTCVGHPLTDDVVIEIG